MRNLIAAAALIALASLAGCGTQASDPIARAADGMEAPGAGDKSLAQEIADKLLGEVTGRELRGVRFCMIAAGISELMTYRVTRFDPGYAKTALGQFAVLRALKDRYAGADPIWFETDLRLALFDLADILIEAGKDRVPALLANFAGGGVNIPGVLKRARVAGGQALLADAVIADIRALLAELKDSGGSTETALASCADRIARNERQVAVIAGAS